MVPTINFGLQPETPGVVANATFEFSIISNFELKRNSRRALANGPMAYKTARTAALRRKQPTPTPTSSA